MLNSTLQQHLGKLVAAEVTRLTNATEPSNLELGHLLRNRHDLKFCQPRYLGCYKFRPTHFTIFGVRSRASSALALWLIRFFSSSGSSANVCSYPSGTNKQS